MGQHQFIPDRVMVKGNDAIVLDYKSGIKEEKHKSQVRKYASLLEEMGYERVSTHLLYTATMELEEVK